MTIWRTPTNAGTTERPLGIHEEQKEILARANNTRDATARCADHICPGLIRCAVYIHAVLKRLSFAGVAGGSTYKLDHAHRGVNPPVQVLLTRRC